MTLSILEALEKTEKVTFDAMNAFMGKFFDSNKLIFSIIGPDSLMKEKK